MLKRIEILINRIFNNIHPLSYFPQGGKVNPKLLPPWGKVGMGVKSKN